MKITIKSGQPIFHKGDVIRRPDGSQLFVIEGPHFRAGRYEYVIEDFTVTPSLKHRILKAIRKVL